LNTQTQKTDHWRFFFQYVKRYRASYSLGVVMLLVTNWLAVSIPRQIGRAIDLLQDTVNWDKSALNTTVLLIAVLALGMMVARTWSRMLFFNPGRAIERDIKNDAFARLTRLQHDFYTEHEPGKLISIVNNDINGIRALGGVVMLQIFNIFFALSLTPYRMWELSPSLTLYCVIPVVLTFLVSYRAVGKMRQLMKVRMQELQGLSTHTVELLSGIDVIRSSRILDWAQRRFAIDNLTLLDRSIQLSRIRTLVFPILSYTDRLIKVLILAFGGAMVINSTLTLGEMVAFLSYATLLAMPFFSMAMIFSAFQNGLVSIESLRKILDQEPHEQDCRHLESEHRDSLFSQGVAVRNLSFTYPGSAEPALKNISFEIKPGQKIGVLGQVGAGKTTLVNCLNRHLDIASNAVFIDDHDITGLSRRDLRSAVRTISQDPFLFSDSVTNNIRFSAGDLASRPVEEALEQSDLLDEVRQFPQGLDTMVGEKGILLSGGQKQRLSLARAIYTPSKLLILDNVLSAVDNETERFLLDQIFNKVHSRSILIVSHRASVLTRVDRILVLEEGEIVASGTHEELLKSSPLYRDTWKIQEKDDRAEGHDGNDAEVPA